MWPRWTVTPAVRHVAELDGVVLAGADGVREVEADLLRVDVEGGDEFNVPYVVFAELDVHQTGHLAGRIGVLVVLDALDQRGGAVAHADDGYANRTHSGCSLCVMDVPDEGPADLRGSHLAVSPDGSGGLLPRRGRPSGSPAVFC